MADSENTEKHVHGSMDISVQEKTFGQFISLVGRGIAVCLIALVLLYLING